MNRKIEFADNVKRLSWHAKYTVWQAILDIVCEDLGDLSLGDSTRFYVCDQNVGDAWQTVGFIAVIDHNGGKWIQYAWTNEGFRGTGVFRSLVERLAFDFPDEKIGMATNASNNPMKAASRACGFQQDIIYLNRPANRQPAKVALAVQP